MQSPPPQHPGQGRLLVSHLLEQMRGEGEPTSRAPSETLTLHAPVTSESLPDKGDSGERVPGADGKPHCMAELNPHPKALERGQQTGLGESVLLVVLAPAGTAGTALHHGLAALVEDGLAFATPGERGKCCLCTGAGGGQSS